MCIGFFIFKFIIMIFVLFSVGCLVIVMKWVWESQEIKHDKGILANEWVIATSFLLVAVAIPFILLMTYKVVEMTFTF
ncbi:hypothetical protein F10086_45 [Staphylococcus phage vB_SauM_JDF86]|nr:hypothetical protein F10086_45 [Staphylococcus phage vB_SauM_JDF86]